MKSNLSADPLKALISRMLHWEYWPFAVLYIPAYFYFLWLASRRRSLFFFTAANPSMDFGGMFGESKAAILDLIPQQYVPKTSLIRKGQTTNAIECGRQIGYPLIAKPDIGERGIWVEKIETESQLKKYAHSIPADFLLQSFVDYPVELGVFYVRLPEEDKGRITSIVRKHFLEVTGDGHSSVLELLKKNMRAVLAADLKSEYISAHGDLVPGKGEKILIEPIGNHSRGTEFLDDVEQIDGALTEAFNKLSRQIPGFYFGRFDLKCRSYDDLLRLEHFKILELNGAGSEPAHIYQPGNSLLKAYKDIFWHLSVLSQISEQNHKLGVPYWTFREGFRRWKAHRRYIRSLSG